MIDSQINLDPALYKTLYFMGIKGVAMTALAIWAKERGFTVVGSDVRDAFPTDEELKAGGITVLHDFDPNHINKQKPDMVIYTGAHGGRDNIEVQEALKVGIPVVPHGKALGMAMSHKRQVSIAGSHGKTTTSSMIASILSVAGLDPSYCVGCGSIGGVGLSGRFGKGEYFVAEADEYATDPGHDSTPRFLWQHPEVLVVTNIDYDHPDVYPDLKAVQTAFLTFSRQQIGKKILVLNADDKKSGLLCDSSDHTLITYGFSKSARYVINKVQFESQMTHFTLFAEGIDVALELRVPGNHNVVNAAAACACARALSVSWEDIKQGLLLFLGAKRRFESLGGTKDIQFYDDYAHHPSEISATIEAARSWFPDNRIIVVFQPHTYSRTKALLSEFALSFFHADILLLTDIYASAREKDTLHMTGKTLVNETMKYQKNVYYTPAGGDVSEVLGKVTKFGDVVIFMGAGDIFTWEKDIVQKFICTK
jgi:UDP-N-acetylmuramate--alanine ligase